MSNKQATHELHRNLGKAARLWRYAQARGLSFAMRAWHKLLACAQALQMSTDRLLILALATPEPYARWTP